MGPAPGSFITLWMYWPAAFLAATGLVLLFWSLLRDRARGRRRCPRCWYDMSGAQALPARCPECGHTVTAERQLLRTRRRWWPAALGLLLLVPLCVVFGRLHGRATYYAVMPRWKAVEETRVGNSTISLYEIRDPMENGNRVVVKSNGRAIIDHEDRTISRVSGLKDVPPGRKDLDGDGVDECIISCFSGGNRCCHRVYVLRLDPKAIQIVADVDGYVAANPPAAGSKHWQLRLTDTSFQYWRSSYVESPKPDLHYRLENGALRIDLESMESAIAPDAASDLGGRATVIAKSGDDQIVKPLLWRTMLELIYSGHEPEAWKFFDRNWPGSAESKEEFRGEFLKVLSSDLWYQDFIAARAARDAGKPIPASRAGMSGRETAQP